MNGIPHTFLSTNVSSLHPDTFVSVFIHSRGHREPERSCDLPKVIQLRNNKDGSRSRTDYGSDALLRLPDRFLWEGDCIVEPNQHNHLTLSVDENGTSLISQ